MDNQYTEIYKKVATSKLLEIIENKEAYLINQAKKKHNKEVVLRLENIKPVGKKQGHSVEKLDNYCIQSFNDEGKFDAKILIPIMPIIFLNNFPNMLFYLNHLCSSLFISGLKILPSQLNLAKPSKTNQSLEQLSASQA